MTATTWHQLPAWSLENAAVRTVVVPQLGAKIVSLFDKISEYEWLVGPMRPVRQANYAAVFVDQDMAGWDEMYPAINAGAYPLPGPFANISIPDHGELWAIPWAAQETSAECLSFTGKGQALPYSFNRRMRLLEPAGLVLDYTVTNTGSAPFRAFWTAHPQFFGAPGTTIELPSHITQVLSVTPDEWWGGTPGTRLNWPGAITSSQEFRTYNHVRFGEKPYSHKYYLPPEAAIDQARLRTARGNWLALAWDALAVPYLGIWIDEQRINTTPVIALEPSSGYFDSLDRAVTEDRCPTLQPGAALSWQLTLTFGNA